MIIDRFIKPDASLKRHVAKTVTWRIVGTLDTMVLGWLITGDPLTGVKIGGVEVMTKMVLYFVHERVWYKINFGLPQRKKHPDEEPETTVQEQKEGEQKKMTP